MALTIVCAKKEQSQGVLALNHFLFELVIILNLLIFAVYWPILHESTIATPEFQNDTPAWIHMHVVHILP